MNFLHVDLDRDIDRLVQESPMPKDFQGDKRYFSDPRFFPKSTSHHSRLHGQISASATAKLKVSSTASPLAQLKAFQSSQVLPLASTSLHNESTQSIADVFNSMKNSSNAGETNQSIGSGGSHNHRENAVATSTYASEMGHCTRTDSLARTNNQKGFSHTFSRNNAVATPSHSDLEIAHSSIVRKVPKRGRGIREYEETFEHHFDQQGTEDIRSSTTPEEEADETLSDSEPEACSLFMWIIRPVPGMPAVRVEGKKSLTDTEFWLSGIVSRRINEKVVETKSGSVYRLEGNMELLDAIVSGYSRSTAEAFWLGFPADWEELIQDHFNCHQHSREPVDVNPQLSSVEEEEICVFETWDKEDGEEETSQETSQEDEMDSEDIGLTDGTIDGILHSLDEDITGLDAAATNRTKEDNERITKRRQPKTSTAIKSRAAKKTKAEKECVLSDWIIKPLPVGGGVHVVGLNESGVMWNSSAIERRLAKNRLLTTTGGVYKLKGKMDTLLAIQQGIPQKIIEKFKNGFPKEWQELLQTILMEKTNTKRANTKPASVSSTRVKSCTREKLATETPPEKIQKTSKRTASNTIPRIKSSSTGKIIKRKGNSSSSQRELSKSVLTDLDKPKNVVLTPNGDIFDLTNLQHSRSGRLIKPPLYWWAGQSICQGKGGYFVKSHTEYADRYCQEFENQFWSAGKKKIYLKTIKAAEDKERSIIKDTSNVKKKKLHIKTYKVRKSEEASMVGRRSITCDTTGSDQSSTTLDSVMSDKQSNRLGMTVPPPTLEKVNDRLDPTVESDKSDNQDDSLPDIEKEIKVVLQRLRPPKRKMRSSPTCYTNCADLNKPTKLHEDVYSLKNLGEDGDDDMTSKPKQKNSTKTSKSVLNKEQVKHDQVSVVSSTTDEFVKLAKPSRARTRSLELRVETADKSIEENQPMVAAKRCPSSRKNSRRNSKKVSVNIESDQCEELQNNSLDVPLVKSSLKRKSIQRKSLKSQTDETVIKPVTLVKSTPKRRSKEKCSESWLDGTIAELDTTDNNVWTAGDRERLNIAFKRTNPNDPGYWEKIAEVVGTKSALVCKEEFYKTEKEASVRKPKRTQEAERKKVTALTANKGTLKRRQQFFTILNQQNEEHSDNLFDATPFRNTRKRKINRAEELEGEDLFGEPSKRNGKSRFETPKGDIEMGRRVFPKFASAKKTPKSDLDLKEFVKRENVDGYVHKFLKRGLHTKGRKKRIGTPKRSKQVCVIPEEDSPQQKLFHEYITAQHSDSENHVDSDQEADYYWSEEETTN